MRSYLLTLFLSLLPISLLAQLEGANWFFGENMGINFSNDQPQIIPGAPLETAEGSASYSTPTGELLFFTNGGGRPFGYGQSTGEIFDSQFNVMHDMNGAEGGGFSAEQSSIIFPVPQENDKFYLFTMEEFEYETGGAIPGQPLGRGLSYFIIDMNANGGLGAVTEADQRIYVPTYEHLTAVQHDNGQDYWVIIGDLDETQFVVFPVTSSGVGIPAMYPVPAGRNNSSAIKASPDRTKIYSDGIIYDFSASTGQFSNPHILPNNVTGRGSFSANSKYLYVGFLLGSLNLEIYQYDVQAVDIGSTINTIAAMEGFLVSQFQLAPDGHIYFSVRTSTSNSFNRITCANSINPDLELGILDIDFGLILSLPNFTDHIFRNDERDAAPTIDLGPDIENCSNQPLVLDAGNPGLSYLWSTGDTTQTIDVMQAGNYAVTVSNNCGQEAMDEINILTNPQFELLNNSTSICANGLVTVPLNLSGVYPVMISYLNNGMPEIANLNMQEDSLTVFVQGPTLLSFSMMSSGNCGIPLTDEFTINFAYDPDTIYINEYTCEVADTGTVVEIIQVPGDCDQIQIAQTMLSPDSGIQFGLPEEIVINLGDSILIQPDFIYPVTTIGLWEDEAGNILCDNCISVFVKPESDASYFFIVEEATCYFQAEVLLKVKRNEKIYFPNSFSPNDDGNNDYYEFFVANNAAQINSFRIYDRWGQVAFAAFDLPASDPRLRWDGTLNGKKYNPGVFIYFVELTFADGAKRSYKGDILLQR